ncbi:hypothetical protein IFM89_034690 [Coptis chinensis]|uniref:Uncharacterized protein n=1 Tax=Coptis chinensis TaxID=261450 RepID=A0A835LXS1_9MAGN|nr:hypothetical protein IFM89_034690 [Coptis chinensis]
MSDINSNIRLPRDVEKNEFPRLTVKYLHKVSRYVFLNNKQWNEFVERNKIQENVHELEIWSFRSDNQQQSLCFAINVRRKNDNQSCNRLQAPSSKYWDNDSG